MTGRRRAVIAVAVAGLVAVGLLVRPLLPAPRQPRDRAAPRASAQQAARFGAVPAPAVRVAVAELTALTCPAEAAHRTGVRVCPTVTVLRAGGYCPTPRRCLVQLIASTRRYGVPVPITATVTVTQPAPAGAWHALQVPT